MQARSTRCIYRAGVEIRLIGRVIKGSRKLGPSRLKRVRFHTRTIIRDRQTAFIGSQSLRQAELDRRRELGLIIDDREVVHSLLTVFESDWARLETRRKEGGEDRVPASRTVKRLAMAVSRELPLEPLVERALKQALSDIPDAEFNNNRFEHRLEDAVRESLENAVSKIVRETVETEART